MVAPGLWSPYIGDVETASGASFARKPCKNETLGDLHDHGSFNGEVIGEQTLEAGFSEGRGAGVERRLTHLILNAIAAPGPLAGNIVKRAKHPAGSALNTIFIGNENFLLGLLPIVNLSGTNHRAGFILAFL